MAAACARAAAVFRAPCETKPPVMPYSAQCWCSHMKGVLRVQGLCPGFNAYWQKERHLHVGLRLPG